MPKLKEAPTKVKIEVTANDIKLGMQGLPHTCAIARAVKRIMGDHPSVSSDIGITINKEYYVYSIPKKAERFIDKFDENKSSVKPFTFIAIRRE